MDWFHNSFGEEYFKLYAHRDAAEAEAQVEFILRNLHLPPQAFVLDTACGDGRHAFAASQRGLQVLGLDYSAVALKRAQSGAGAKIALIQGDYRYLPFAPRSFELLLNMFTSFGYLQSDKEHKELLRSWYSLLKTAGYLVLDYLNREKVISELIAESRSETAQEEIWQRRYLTADLSRVNKDVVIIDKSSGEKRSLSESVRMFSRSELELLISKAGFAVRHVFGDFDGQAFLAQSPRLIIFAQAT